MSRPIIVGITHGDYNGIGYEVILKALAAEKITELFTPVVFGSAKLFEKARKDLDIELPFYEVIKKTSDIRPGKINIMDLDLGDAPLNPGQPTEESGRAAVRALEKAVDALKAGEIQTLVTAPICKKNVQSDHFNFPGHTEFLETRLGEEGDKAQMILFADKLRVALVTTHLPLSEVSSKITKEAVMESVERFDKTLRSDFGCERPKIAVLSLNPHNGDGGLLGDEEQKAIIPAIDDLLSRGILAFGPYAADGFFATSAWRHYDGVLAMYHDQGLAPFKALAEDRGVNFTAGLPFVRTSPDHGTAFDKAWKGEADATSMREAIYASIDILRSRERYRRASANPLRKARVEKGTDKTIDLSKETL